AKTQKTTRVLLCSRGRFFCSRAACKSAASSVDFFRYLSRHPAPQLRVDVSPGAGGCAGDRTAVGSSLDRRVVEYSRDVYGNDLDVAGLDAAGIGAARRRADFLEARTLQLLDEQLLGRRRGRDSRRTGLGGV